MAGVPMVHSCIERNRDLFIEFTEVQPREQDIDNYNKEQVLLLPDFRESSLLHNVMGGSICSAKQIEREHLLSARVVLYQER